MVVDVVDILGGNNLAVGAVGAHLGDGSLLQCLGLLGGGCYRLLHFSKHLDLVKTVQVAVEVFHSDVVYVVHAKDVGQLFVQNLLDICQCFGACDNLPATVNALFEDGSGCAIFVVEAGKGKLLFAGKKLHFHILEIFRLFPKAEIQVGVEFATTSCGDGFALSSGTKGKYLFISLWIDCNYFANFHTNLANFDITFANLL